MLQVDALEPALTTPVRSFLQHSIYNGDELVGCFLNYRVVCFFFIVVVSIDPGEEQTALSFDHYTAY